MSKSIFEEILETKSFTVIQCKTEQAIPLATGQEKDALERILLAHKNDEIYALCNEMLGNHEEAKNLRDFMALKAVKTPVGMESF